MGNGQIYLASLSQQVGYIYTPSALNAGAERRAIWPCLNVATWRTERSDRAIQQIC